MSLKINDTKRHIAYICPMCSKVCKTDVNLFMFSGSKPVNFICDSQICLEECISISGAKDKLAISVDCPVCGNRHTFKISLKTFLSKDIITLSCPESNIKIFFAGKEDLVEFAITESQGSLSDFEEGLEAFNAQVDIVYEIVDLIYEMLSCGDIVCECGSNRDIIPDVTENGIVLSCLKCKNKIVIPPTEEGLCMLESEDKFKF